jgi:hypothetical protein
MLEEAVRHLLEAEAHVLEADLLGDHQQGQRRSLRVGVAHEARQHGRIAHAGVEDANCRWRRADMAQFLGRALRDRRLLVAGVDEGEVFLAIVVEAEWRRVRRRARDFHRATRTRAHGR